MKIQNVPIGDRTRDLPACSAVPQPRATSGDVRGVQIMTLQTMLVTVTRLSTTLCRVMQQVIMKSETVWIGVLLVTQPLTFRSLYGPRMISTVFTKPATSPRPKENKSTPLLQPVSLRSSFNNAMSLLLSSSRNRCFRLSLCISHLVCAACPYDIDCRKVWWGVS